MYKVFRDPEGTRYLDQSISAIGATNRTATLHYPEELEAYKQKIQSLNVEILRLNDELQKVPACIHATKKHNPKICIYALFHSLVAYTDKFFSLLWLHL